MVHLLRSSWSLVKKYRLYLAISLFHYLLTTACGFILFLEGFDRAIGENKFAISDWALQFCLMALKFLLFPIGYLIIFNKSLVIGVTAVNSLFIGFSPLWIPKLWQRFEKTKPE